jgi:PAS domain S-box-containing protein
VKREPETPEFDKEPGSSIWFFRPDIGRDVLQIAIVAALYVAGAKLGFSFAFQTKQVTALWPPTGIAVAALFLLGPRVWPGILLGAFISNAMTNETLLTAAAIAIGNTLAPVAGVTLVNRFVDFDTRLERLRDVLGLILISAAVAMTISATNGTLNLALAKIIPWSMFGSVWRLWWVGDAMGVMLFAPLILTWASGQRWAKARWRDVLELAIFSAALLVATWLLFMQGSPVVEYPIYPLIIWSGLRFTQRVTSLTVVVVSAIAIWGTVHGLGPFAVGSLDHRVSILVTFMAVMVATGLALGAVTAERRLANTHLKAAERRFHVLAEIVPQMVWTADPTGWFDWYNQRYFDHTGQSLKESAGWGWQGVVHPHDLPRVMKDWPRSIATGEPFEMEARIRHSDGSYRWFLVRAQPSRDEIGAVARWYGTCTDIDDQKRALQQTVKAAETLQTALLPGRLPVRPDLHFDALYLTAEREALIGGDWYDAFELPTGQLVVSIGDVTGHGLNAAVTASRIRQSIFAAAIEEPNPAMVLAKVNRILHIQEESLATALVAVIDNDLAVMRYASAGHPPPMIATYAASAQSLPLGGLPLGVALDLELVVHSVTLQRDALLLFYTDGVTEFSRDLSAAEGVLLRTLTRLAREVTQKRPAVVLQRAVMGFDRPTDDAVLMVLQLTPRPVPRQSEDGDLHKTWTFHSSSAYSAHTSRHELMSFVRGFVTSDDELYRFELLIGEILANTVKHAPGLVTVEIDWGRKIPLMTIHDTGPGLAEFSPQLPQDEFTENGRGLFLISALARAVHLETSIDAGTTMMIELPASNHVSSTSQISPR